MAECVDPVAVDEGDRTCCGDVEIAVEKHGANWIAGMELRVFCGSHRRSARRRPARNGDEAHRIEVLRKARDRVGREAGKRKRHGNQLGAGHRARRRRTCEPALEFFEEIRRLLVRQRAEEFRTAHARRRRHDRRRCRAAEVGDLEHFLDGSDPRDGLLFKLKVIRSKVLAREQETARQLAGHPS